MRSRISPRKTGPALSVVLRGLERAKKLRNVPDIRGSLKRFTSAPRLDTRLETQTLDRHPNRACYPSDSRMTATNFGLLTVRDSLKILSPNNRCRKIWGQRFSPFRGSVSVGAFYLSAA